MSDDLLKRLKRRKIIHINEDGYSFTEIVNPDGDDAAGEIERLKRENAELREALKPFADVGIWEGYKDDEKVLGGMTIGDLRRAKAVYDVTAQFRT
jgi:hypothetical protein